MNSNELTFNDLPQVVAQLRDEVMGMRSILQGMQVENRNVIRVNRHKPMTVDEASDYSRIPLGTFYMKLASGEIPATKPGKRYVIYQDELDKWLETHRKNEVPMSADEENEAILSSHKRKPNRRSWG